MDKAALAISILALIASSLAALYARQQADSTKRLTRVEESRHAIEIKDREAAEAAAKIADVRVTLQFEGFGEPSRLAIYNAGPAIASRVSVQLEATAGDAPMFVADTKRQSVPDLRNGDRQIVRLVTDYETGAIFDAILRWTDLRGNHETRTRFSEFQ